VGGQAAALQLRTSLHQLAVRGPAAPAPTALQRAALCTAAVAAGFAASACEGETGAPLAKLDDIRDAKEIVLYQYAVCPFCNKAPRLPTSPSAAAVPICLRRGGPGPAASLQCRVMRC